MIVTDKNEKRVDDIQNESDDSDNQDSLDQNPGVDIVEDFARQLDELCMSTAHLNTNHEKNDDFIPFGYEQLPQDEEGFGILDSDYNDDDYNEEEKGIKNNDIKLEDNDQLVNENEQQTITNSSIVKPLTIPVDSSEKLPIETSDLIMNIMKNINLPDHAIPSWAKNIPESKWLPKLEENK